MKFCPGCGQQAVDTAKFCRACGNALPTAAPPPIPDPAVAPPPVASSSAGSPPPIPQTQPAAQSAQAVEEELETPPPPPAKGITFTWQQQKQGLSRSSQNVPPEVAVGNPHLPVRIDSPASASAAASAPPPPSSATASPAGTTSFTKMVGATEPVNLPPPPPTQWKFRDQTGAWADKISETLRGAAASSNASLAGTLTRIVRGAFMHRQIYREAAANPQFNTEALYVAAAIIIAGFIGLWFTGIGFLYSGSLTMLLRIALLRIVSWGAAVFAIQYAAKSLHQVNLPAAAWFRALIFAQAPTFLMIVPAIGTLSGIWSAVCSVAAIHDLEGRDTVSAIIVAVIGAVAASVAAYFGGIILLRIF